jgi:hypothetical protein
MNNAHKRVFGIRGERAASFALSPASYINLLKGNFKKRVRKNAQHG